MQALLLPFLAALAVAWAGATLAGRGKAADFWPALGLAAALALVAWLVAGPHHFPPNGAVEKLTYMIAAGLAVGLIAESLSGGSGLRAVCLLWPWLVVGWLAWPVIARMDWPGIAAAAGIALAGTLTQSRLAQARGGAAPLVLLVAAVALGGVAYYGASYSMAQIMSALGAGLAGAALGHWLSRGGGGLAFGGPLLLVGGGAFAGMAAILLLYTSANPWAAAFLLPVFFADALAAQAVGGGGGGLWKGLRTLVFLIALLAPAVAAVLLARHLGGAPY